MKRCTTNNRFTARFSKCSWALALMALPLMAVTDLWAGEGASRPLCTVAEQAETGDFFFEAQLTNGEKMSIPFAERPEMRLTGTAYQLKSTKTEVTLPYDEVDRFVIVQATTAVEEVEVQREEMQRNGNVFAFSNCHSGSSVYVYDRNGRMVTKAVADVNGCCEVSLEGQPAGVYVIKSEFVNLKVLKK